MKKTYYYSRWAACAYSTLLILPLLAWIFFFKMGFPKTKEGWLVFLLFNLILLLVAMSIIVWALNILKTRIYIDEDGFIYQSLFKKVTIAWKDIAKIERKYLYGGKYGGPPRDLVVRTKSNKIIRILYFLENDSGIERGIDEFEAVLKKHLK